MYNSPPHMIPGQTPVSAVVYPNQQRPYNSNLQFYQPNGPRPPSGQYIPQNGPQPALQHSSSISSNAESNTSPPSLAGTPGPEKHQLRQPTPTVYFYPHIQRPQQFVQTPQPRPQVVNMMRPPPQMIRYSHMQYMQIVPQRPPLQQNQSFPIGHFYAPSQSQDSHHYEGGQKGGSRGKRGKSDPNKRNSNKTDGLKQETKTSSGSSPDASKPPPMMEQQQHLPIQQQPMMAQNPVFVYSQPPMQMAPQMQPMYHPGTVYQTNQGLFYGADGGLYMYPNNGLMDVAMPMAQPPMTAAPEIPVQPQPMGEQTNMSIMRAVHDVVMETKAKEQASEKNPMDCNSETADAKEDSVDLEDYTPPGTPQELSPLNEEQTEQFMNELKIGEMKKEKQDEYQKADKRRKPEQQHYQPPRAARSQAKRTDSWRSSNSSNSNVSDEKPKVSTQVETKQEPKTEVTEIKSSASTPTPRATPVPMEQKPEVPAVPMIGGIPILPAQTDVNVTPEFCAYCEMKGKTMSVVTNHSMMSSKGLPACPYLRDEGCKLCGEKGDRAHYFEYCKKKFSKRKNVEFQKLGSYLFNMSSELRRNLVLKDMRNHPTVEMVTVTEDPNAQVRNSNALKRVIIKQKHLAKSDRQKFDEDEFIYEHQHHHYDRRDQGHRGRGGSRNSGQYYGNNRARGGSSDRGNRNSRNRYDGQRRDRGNRQNYH